MPDNLNNQPTPSYDNNPVPPPPPPSGSSSVDIRTQSSDIQSIKQSGGGSPTPNQFNLGEVNPSSSVPPSDSSNISNNNTPPPSPSNIPPSPIGGSPTSPDGEPIFNPSDAPAENNNPYKNAGKSLNLRVILLVAGIVILIALLGWVGYAYIYPVFFSAEQVTELNPPPSPMPESNEEVLPLEETTPEISHSPFISFSSSPLGSVLASSAFMLDLTNVASSATATPNSFKEISVVDTKGNQAPFYDFLPLLLPNFTTSELINFFEPDFTALVYYDDSSNIWPGYIAKLKSDTSLLDAQDKIFNLENSETLTTLFIQDPGQMNSEGWKDGQINSLPTRYLTFSNGGALNYFWSGNKLIIVTSYQAAQSLIPLLE